MRRAHHLAGAQERMEAGSCISTCMLSSRLVAASIISRLLDLCHKAISSTHAACSSYESTSWNLLEATSHWIRVALLSLPAGAVSFVSERSGVPATSTSLL